MHSFRQSPADPAFVQDPYPAYEAMRREGDIVMWEDYGMAAAVSHEAVQAILRGRDFARLPPAGHEAPTPWDDLPAFRRLEEASMLSNEAPRHPVLRRSVVTAFTNARVQAMAPQIEALCHELIDAFPRGPFDLLSAYCTPIPVTVIAQMLGEPVALAPKLLEWSHAMVRLYTQAPQGAERAAAERASAEFAAHLTASLATKEGRADGDLAQALKAEAEAGRLSADEVLGTCVLLLNAGHEATVHAIGNAVRLLLATPDPAALASAGQVAATAEEALRLDPPLHLFTRYTQRDTEVAGHAFAKGRQVACLLGAANRDPAVFDAPAAFRPGRNAKALTSFGAGVHFCLGAPLARLEMQIALRVLFARLPGLRLAEPPAFAPTYHFHGLSRLMVTQGKA
ncbi:cytochrome P450 [Mangrovicoccus algicola]|uniref:Cytochrome P450 n=1 Tax=Mangrovicoccus algicola TaxID=2771008 RepID=A0A8J6YVM0_9RHOB|nr:cytochrome P450 [Mangrovicoccus algicola]MBE3637024.1 cytochrome P450 [Mangrovicoccus algicola]